MLWIYDIPTWQLISLISALFLGINFVGTLLFRWMLGFRRADRVPEKVELYATFFGNHGVYMSILVGLLAVGVYNNMSEADGKAHSEAIAAGALYRCFTMYPEPMRGRMQASMLAYLDQVQKKEWPMQQRGEVPPTTHPTLGAIFQELIAFNPNNKPMEIAHAETLHAIREFYQKRRDRLFALEDNIAPLLWYVVIIGSLVTMVLVWLMDMGLVDHLMYGSLSAFFQAALIGYILAMDNPFMGDQSVSPEPYQQVVQELRTMPADLIPANSQANQ